MFCLVCIKLNDGKRVRANVSYLPSELKQNCDSATEKTVQTWDNANNINLNYTY